MKTLVISDIHLGKHFRKKKFEYLKNLFGKYDQIVINGDFWDYYSFSFEDFVKSKWSELFPILKNKTTYLYGNHDKRKWSDERVKLFSKKTAQKISLKFPRIEYMLEHGDIFDNSWQPEFGWFVKLDRILSLNTLTLAIDITISRFKKDKSEKISDFVKSINKNKILVTGHFHKPVFKLKDNYIVTGYVLGGKASYLEIEGNGKARLVKERY